MNSKPTIAFVSLMGLLTAGALALLFSVMKPDGTREYDDQSKSPADFPRSSAQTPPPQNIPEAPLSMPLASIQKRKARGQADASSLDLLRKEAGAAAPQEGPLFQTAATQAPAPPGQGQAAQASPPPVQNPADPVWELVNALPKSVRTIDPRWYREFNATKSLASSRAQYGDSRDFKAFLRALAQSQAFNHMLSARKGKRPLRQIIESLFMNEEFRPKLRAMLSAYGDDPNLRKMVSRYGPGSLPPQVLAALGANGQPQKQGLRLRPMQLPNFNTRQRQTSYSSQGFDQYKNYPDSSRH